MRVVFNGNLEVRSGGCGACGTKKKSKRSLVTSKLYFLPSGRQVTFYVGREEEVDDADGEFLLQYQYTDANGNMRTTFSRVD